MRINGWHRLWILTSLALLGVLAVVAANIWPSEAGVPHSLALYENLSASARAQIAATEAEASARVRMPNGHVINLKPDAAASRKTEALLQYQQAVLQKVQDLRTELVVRLLAWWVGVCSAVLVFGHLVAWVRAGFAKPSLK